MTPLVKRDLMSFPKITVITAVFNGGGTLENTINSLRNQNIDFEYIVIDGGSKDNTLDIILNNSDFIDKYISEPDSGIYDAWNKGVKIASGEWVAFLGADDELEPLALINYAKFIKKLDADVEYVSSIVEYSHLNKYPLNIGAEWSWNALRTKMVVAHVASMHKMSLLVRLNGFNIDYKICADYDFLLRAGPMLKAKFMPILTAKMGGLGVSNTKFFSVCWEVSIIKYKNGVIPLISIILNFTGLYLKIVIKKIYAKHTR